MHISKPVSPGGAVGLSELVSALSYALDISEGHPTGHCVRSCWIGFHIGREAGCEYASKVDPAQASHNGLILL
jgi:hypothetical protein